MERIAIEIGVVVVCILSSIFAVRCANERAENADKQAQEALRETKELRSMLERANEENTRTREFMAKYDEAMTRSHIAVEQALSRTNERLEKIETIDSDWRLEPVPVGVCDMFADYTNGDSTGAASTDSVAPMCEATDLSNQDK